MVINRAPGARLDSDLYLVDASTGSVSTLPRLAGRGVLGILSFSPEGDRLLVSQDAEGASALWSVNTDGSGARLLVADAKLRRVAHIAGPTLRAKPLHNTGQDLPIREPIALGARFPRLHSWLTGQVRAAHVRKDNAKETSDATQANHGTGRTRGDDADHGRRHNDHRVRRRPE